MILKKPKYSIGTLFLYRSMPAYRIIDYNSFFKHYRVFSFVLNCVEIFNKTTIKVLETQYKIV